MLAVVTNARAFHDLPPTPAVHFKLCLYLAILRLCGRVSQALGPPDHALERFPFLAGYRDELTRRGIAGVPDKQAEQWWRAALREWEADVPDHLPLRALRDAAGLDDAAIAVLLCIGLVEEDGRFGAVFEALQGAPGLARPTLGLLVTWWGSTADEADVRAAVARLRALGLVHVPNPDQPRSEWLLQPDPVIWDALRGDPPTTLAPGLSFRFREHLTRLDDLIVPAAQRATLAQLPTLLGSGEAQALVVRGPRQNGRRTLVSAVARALGRGVLEVAGPAPGAPEPRPAPDRAQWRQVGPLATALHALPLAVLDLAPGETVELPALDGYVGPLAVVLGKAGGLTGSAVAQAVTLTLDPPDVAARQAHWEQALGPGVEVGDDVGEAAARYRLTGGTIRRVAGQARAYARLNGRPAPTLADIQVASRAVNRQALDTLASVVPPLSGDWGSLAVAAETGRELGDLERRCRHREGLGDALAPVLRAQWGAGVRALFTGPSGTGKTLAARLLAARLQKDLYRLDLSAVVNKYIGETEKNLEQVLSRAEELDVVLLLDEGDALLSERTSVQTSNDRYANLETNYLLQRLETFEGILLVTTNAGGRIDAGFKRRMDVIVDFQPPDAAERWAIWRLHLPADHLVDSGLLQNVARRCTLTGGQIRNAVLHASLLALDDHWGGITDAHLTRAVAREYRKLGAVCPLRGPDEESDHLTHTWQPTRSP